MSAAKKVLHPFCNVCGWRKGGPDCWDKNKCKCGHYAPPMLTCEVCAEDISHDFGRCTNGRCSKCHAKHCTPGGATSPGHGRGHVEERTILETRYDIYEEAMRKLGHPVKTFDEWLAS